MKKDIERPTETYLYPNVETEFYNENKNKPHTTKVLTCFNHFWDFVGDSSFIKVRRSSASYKERNYKIPYRDLMFYVSQMKKHNIFPKNWTYKDIKNREKFLTINLNDFKNGLHLYACICSWRPIWDKPQIINNCVILNKKYNVPWPEAFFIASTISYNDSYYSLLNAGYAPKTNEDIKDYLIPVEKLPIINKIFTKPEFFGEEKIDHNSVRRFKSYLYFEEYQTVKSIYKRSYFTNITCDLCKKIKLSNYLKEVSSTNV